MTDIGEKLKKLRQSADLNQSGFAAEIGVHYQTVSKWERGLVTPDLSAYDVIIKYFNVSLEYLLDAPEENAVTGSFTAEGVSHALMMIRKNEGLSQSEFAARIDTKVDKISKWERGVTLPDIEEILRISQVFGLPPSAIYYGAVESDTNNRHLRTSVKTGNKSVKRWLIAACSLFASLLVAVCICTPIIVTELNEWQALLKQSDNGEPPYTPSPDAPEINELGYCPPLKDAVMMHEFKSLVYNGTLSQYQVHDTGIDIVAAVGQDVYSVVTGKVVEISQDSVYGWQIVKLSDNYGLTVVYRYCAPKEGLERGDTVAAGELIGTVTKVAYYEKSFDPHLHVEVYLNGIIQNPCDYFYVAPAETN